MSADVQGHETTVLGEADREYLRTVHQANLAEIAAGRVAVERASHEAVRRLGQLLVGDHTDLDIGLVAVARDLEVELPEAPAPEQQADLARVLARSGTQLDGAWLEMQVAAHRRTVALGDHELEHGSQVQVRDLAHTAAPRLRHHLEAALENADALGITLGAQGTSAAPGRPPATPAGVERGEAGRGWPAPFLAGLAVGLTLGVLIAVRAGGRRAIT